MYSCNDKVLLLLPYYKPLLPLPVRRRQPPTGNKQAISRISHTLFFRSDLVICCIMAKYIHDVGRCRRCRRHGAHECMLLLQETTHPRGHPRSSTRTTFSGSSLQVVETGSRQAKCIGTYVQRGIDCPQGRNP